MSITGLPKKYKGIYLAYFNYSATCEGKTVEAQIVYGKEYLKYIKDIEGQLKIGWEEPFRPKLIPATTEKEFHKIKYLDWSDEFKSKFYECFGFSAFRDFLFCCESEGTIDLVYKMNYNFS